jgi:hypothetical protein
MSDIDNTTLYEQFVTARQAAMIRTATDSGTTCCARPNPLERRLQQGNFTEQQSARELTLIESSDRAWHVIRAVRSCAAQRPNCEYARCSRAEAKH